MGCGGGATEARQKVTQMISEKLRSRENSGEENGLGDNIQYSQGEVSERSVQLHEAVQSELIEFFHQARVEWWRRWRTRSLAGGELLLCLA